MANNENEVFRSYKLNELSPNELLAHGDTEMVSKLFLKHIIPFIKKSNSSKVAGVPFSILELGGGTCFESYYLKRELPKSEIYSTDISPYVLVVSKSLSKIFKTNLDNCCSCDAQHLPFKDRSFDVVFGTEFLHHCESLLAATKEIRRILRPSGCFFGIEPMCGRISKPIVLVLSGAKSRTINEHVLENRYNFSEWTFAFQKAGLTVDLSTIDDTKIYKSLIGRKCNPSSFKGRYLTKYVYSNFLNIIPTNLRRYLPNATLRIVATKTNGC